MTRTLKRLDVKVKEVGRSTSRPPQVQGLRPSALQSSATPPLALQQSVATPPRRPGHPNGEVIRPWVSAASEASGPVLSGVAGPILSDVPSARSVQSASDAPMDTTQQL